MAAWDVPRLALIFTDDKRKRLESLANRSGSASMLAPAPHRAGLRQRPGKPATQWSVRALAKATGLNLMAINRI